MYSFSCIVERYMHIIHAYKGDILMSTTEQMKEHFESFIAENEKFTIFIAKRDVSNLKELIFIKNDFFFNINFAIYCTLHMCKILG